MNEALDVWQKMLDRGNMTNEELAIKIQQGDTELIPLLWEQVSRS